jgi:predicted TIM-barrel fold metal-dependent hydrolase
MAVVHNMSDLFSIPDKWGEIARIYPDVPILLYHMGVPYMVDSAIELARKYDNVFLGSACSFAPAIKKAYDTIGASKIMLASDAPFVSMAQEIDKVKYVIKKDEELEQVLGGNAKRVLGL